MRRFGLTVASEIATLLNVPIGITAICVSAGKWPQSVWTPDIKILVAIMLTLLSVAILGFLVRLRVLETTEETRREAFENWMTNMDERCQRLIQKAADEKAAEIRHMNEGNVNALSTIVSRLNAIESRFDPGIGPRR